MIDTLIPVWMPTVVILVAFVTGCFVLIGVCIHLIHFSIGWIYDGYLTLTKMNTIFKEFAEYKKKQRYGEPFTPKLKEEDESCK